MKNRIILILILAVAVIGFAFLRNPPKTHAPDLANTSQNTTTQPTQTAVDVSLTVKPPMVPGTDKLWIPTLVYHRIEDAPATASDMYKQMTVSPEWFDKQMKYLADNKFTPIHFTDVTNYLEKGTALPARPIIITFDDGWKNQYTAALPILKKYKMTGTLYIIAGYIGYGAYLNVDELKEMRDYGMEIAAHSMTHPSLTLVKNAKEEIENSKKILEEKLGVVVTAFAYPNGAFNAAVEQLVKNAGYKTGRAFGNGIGISKDNLYELPVVRIDKNQGLEKWEKQLYPEGHP